MRTVVGDDGVDFSPALVPKARTSSFMGHPSAGGGMGWGPSRQHCVLRSGDIHNPGAGLGGEVRARGLAEARGCKRLTVLPTVRWNSHPVFSDLGGGVLPSWRWRRKVAVTELEISPPPLTPPRWGCSNSVAGWKPASSFLESQESAPIPIDLCGALEPGAGESLRRALAGIGTPPPGARFPGGGEGSVPRPSATRAGPSAPPRAGDPGRRGSPRKALPLIGKHPQGTEVKAITFSNMQIWGHTAARGRRRRRRRRHGSETRNSDSFEPMIKRIPFVK